MRTRLPGWCVALVATAVLIVGGCQSAQPRPNDSAHLVWILPGVGAGPLMMSGVRQAFIDAGVRGEIRIAEWDRPILDILGQLQNHAANEALAGELAERTADYWCTHPGARIDVVGYSAGGGIALLLAEALPEDVRLRNVVLVQPGVSPTWELSRALRVVDGQIVNFYCPSDWFILGLGTRTFGTVDRQNVASAGKDGFDVAAAVPDAGQRSKLEQRPWAPRMIATGHIGNHISILLYGWNRQYVAPYVGDDSSDAAR